MDRILRLSNETLGEFRKHLQRHEEEDAVFFLFRRLEARQRDVIMVRKVIPIPEEFVVRRSRDEILFEGAALVKAFTQARLDGSYLGFAHSHPSGAIGFSQKDDVVDQSILETISNRLE